jgi:hypothetical protein
MPCIPWGRAEAMVEKRAARPRVLVNIIFRRDGGGVKITNNLAQDVYAWSVAGDVGPMQTIKEEGSKAESLGEHHLER